MIVIATALAMSFAGQAAGQGQPRRTLEDGARGAFTFHSIGQSRAIVLPGTLRLPSIGRRPYPAVIIAGDLPGPDAAAATLYAERLLTTGVAVFSIDSFAARGLREPGEAAGLASLRQVEDVYAALNLLRSHPGVASSRIGLLGLGRGGLAAIEASLSALRDIARGDSPAQAASFAAVAALYPSCALQWRPVESIDRPVLMQLGALDDLASTSHCEDYARRLRLGNPAGVTVRVYPGLNSAWGSPPFERPEAERLDRCLALLDLDGSLTERATGLRHQRGQISSFLDQCRLRGRRGGGGDPESVARAAADLMTFLAASGVGRSDP